jgi:hypothetical protein
MTDDRRQGWPHDPEALPDGGTGKAAAGLFEGFVRDACVNGSVFLSLITVIAGFVTGDALWMVVGVLVGVPGIVLPWLSVGRKWAVPKMWATVLAVIVADLAALTLMWTTT